jgi:hypothetical protein
MSKLLVQKRAKTPCAALECMREIVTWYSLLCALATEGMGISLYESVCDTQTDISHAVCL